MNSKELAQKLDGREYGKEITKEEEALAKENNLVVVYGASDDLVEIVGALSDEFGDHNIAFNKKGFIKNECDDDDCPYFKEKLKSAKTIKAIWNKDGYSWIYKTNIPHATFEILEGDEKYCRGIVFNLSI